MATPRRPRKRRTPPKPPDIPHKKTPHQDPGNSPETTRINRYLSSAGICSRRAADELVAAGEVTINSKVAELGATLRPGIDEVRYRGRKVVLLKRIHLAFNKPVGVICTNSVRERRTRVIDCLPRIQGRLYTVGRLDYDSQGLILVTNDGDFAQAISHPSHEVKKSYEVLVRGAISREAIDQARAGVFIGDCTTGPAQVIAQRIGREQSAVLITIHEGKNRELRRLFGRLGHPVLRLRRIRIGCLSLGELPEGEHRHLSKDEVRDLLRIAHQRGSQPKRPPM